MSTNDLVINDTVQCCLIRDDGVGFDAVTALTRPGVCTLGMAGIRSRLEALGGTFQVTSAPGQGTELLATIPLVD